MRDSIDSTEKDAMYAKKTSARSAFFIYLFFAREWFKI